MQRSVTGKSSLLLCETGVPSAAVCYTQARAIYTVSIYRCWDSLHLVIKPDKKARSFNLFARERSHMTVSMINEKVETKREGARKGERERIHSEKL